VTTSRSPRPALLRERLLTELRAFVEDNYRELRLDRGDRRLRGSQTSAMTLRTLDVLLRASAWGVGPLY
jgi:hypothetical protein